MITTLLEHIIFMNVEGDIVDRTVLNVNGHDVQIVRYNQDKTALLMVDDTITVEKIENLKAMTEARCS